MKPSEENKYGWSFPIGVDQKTGGIKTTDYASDIKQSIIILLNTRPGERLGHPDYGCDLLRFTFESISYRLIKDIRDEILRSIERWENRIKNINIDALAPEGNSTELIFEIQYEITKTGVHDEVLYEFTNT